MKVATVALTSVLVLGASSAIAHIDSRIDSNASTGAGIPTGSGGDRPSSGARSRAGCTLIKIPGEIGFAERTAERAEAVARR